MSQLDYEGDDLSVVQSVVQSGYGSSLLLTQMPLLDYSKRTDNNMLPDWVVIYGDMMALLLCFFVTLFSMSTFQKPQIQNMIMSFKSGFNNQSTGEYDSSKRPMISLTARRIDTYDGNSTIQTIVFDIESIPGGIIKFDLGSDELKDESKEELLAIVDKLRSIPFKILIYGYESTKDEGGEYRRELDLSYARAVAVYEFLILHGLERNSLQVVPMGKSKPLNNEENALVELKIKLENPQQ
ncbi:MAG: OmpA family protein [Planctomycetaceae bacterium]|jgi:peptidoglycan-associated lipoprotein|nr:OmpA family protein [Planctomycetaceae bacterium]